MVFFDNYLPTRERIDEDTFESSKNVSGLRRFTMVCLDFFIYLFVLMIVSIFLNNEYIVYIVFTLYFVVCPSLTGKTPASKFLHIKIAYPNKVVLRNIAKMLIMWLYYLVLPIGFIFVVLAFSALLRTSTTVLYLIYGCAFLCVLLFYFISVVKLLKNGKMFYDKWIKFTLESTLVERKKCLEIKNL